jgi:hypothetical protein
LANVANLSKRINLVNASEEANEDSLSTGTGDFSDYFPHLIWVLRDFSLDMGNNSPK